MYTENDILHVIGISYNVGLYDNIVIKNFGWTPDEWFNHRLDLFKNKCLDSLIKQTNKNFICIILFDVKTPENHRKEIRKFNFSDINVIIKYVNKTETKSGNVHINGTLYNEIKKELIPFISDEKILITTGLDNDDAIEPEFVEVLWRKAIETLHNNKLHKFALNFTNLEVINIMDGVSENTITKQNNTISLVELIHKQDVINTINMQEAYRDAKSKIIELKKMIDSLAGKMKSIRSEISQFKTKGWIKTIWLNKEHHSRDRQKIYQIGEGNTFVKKIHHAINYGRIMKNKYLNVEKTISDKKNIHTVYHKAKHKIINWVIRERGYESYLEIGIARPENNFDVIRIAHKDGVDPSGKCGYKMTSDEFFNINSKKYDIIFIDGLHLEEQVLRDVDHSLNCLNDNGIIICHDTIPPDENHQRTDRSSGHGGWCGTVWKAIAKLRMTRDDLEIFTFNTPFGLTFINRGNSELLDIEEGELDYKVFDKYRKELLNIVTIGQLNDIIKKKARIKCTKTPSYYLKNMASNILKKIRGYLK